MLRTASSLPPKGLLTLGSGPVSRRSRQPATGPPGSYPDRTSTGRRRRAYEPKKDTMASVTVAPPFLLGARLLAQRLPVPFELLLYAFVISLLIAIPVATFAARKPGGIFDSITTFIAIVGLSIAPYILALLLILFFAVDLSLFPALGWTPISGGLGANLRSLTLPALSLGFP